MAESPCQTASPKPTQAAPTASNNADTTQYWCYHCEKRVSIETLANLPDIICRECKNGFVETISATLLPLLSPPLLTPDHADDPSFGTQFLQVLRLFSQAVHDDGVSHLQPQGAQSEDDFLRIELDGWDNDEDGDDGNENDENDGNDENDRNDNVEEEENEGGDETEQGEDRSDNDEEGNADTDYVEYLRRRRNDLLLLQLQDFRNQRGNWAEILMGSDNSIEFRLEVPESDRYVGNPEDYVDAAGYEALLRTSKAAVLELPVVKILSDQEAVVCAICKDVINVGETGTKIPCGHVYHGDCIVPWLGLRNTCPVCRFELPTDDPEYEEERKKRVTPRPSVGGASSSSGQNSSLG